MHLYIHIYIYLFIYIIINIDIYYNVYIYILYIVFRHRFFPMKYTRLVLNSTFGKQIWAIDSDNHE